jgi:uncharacterized membrane protein YcaP (DUF421 family)
MFDMTLPVWELIARAAAVYFALLILVRVSGKRTIGEFSPFDVIVLLLLSEAVQGSLTGSEESLQGGLIVVATLIALNLILAFVSTRSRKVESILEGEPVVLVRNGELRKQAMLRNNIPEGDLDEAMRGAKIKHRRDVHLAILEPDGEISFFRKE